jgi:uncharacterized protein (DUF2147 family)
MRERLHFILAASLAVFIFMAPAHAFPTIDPVVGLWYTENKEGGVQFFNCGNEICGRLYYLRDSLDEDGGLSRDIHNPDLSLRDRPLCHLQFIKGFKPDQMGHYADGIIYSPRHGANFNAEMTLLDGNTLKVRGYLLIPLFGESQIWTRARTMPECSTPPGVR